MPESPKWRSVDFSGLAGEHLTLAYHRTDNGLWIGLLKGPAEIKRRSGVVAAARFTEDSEVALVRAAKDYVRRHYPRKRP